MKQHNNISKLGIIISLLFISIIIILLSGCSNTGKFDKNDVSQQAIEYMHNKYGDELSVAKIWEAKHYNLFGYESEERVFITMSDGTVVIVGFGSNADEAILDNKQSDEILDVYNKYIENAIEQCRSEYIDEGYEVGDIVVNDGILLEESKTVSERYWGKDDNSNHDSFFHSLYDGNDEEFIKNEQPYAYIGRLEISYNIAGKDADYEGAFPTSVPEEPAWKDNADNLSDILSKISENPTYAISIYQNGYMDEQYEDENDGLLGELRPYGSYSGWKIVDWVYIGKGIYITSDENGVRISNDDITLTQDALPDDSILDSSMEGKQYKINRNIMEAYQISIEPSLTKKLSSDMVERGWLYIRLAYDRSDETTGITDYDIDSTSPTLYEIDENIDYMVDSNTGREYEEKSYSITAGNTFLTNGFIELDKAIYLDDGIKLIRM